MKFKLPLIVIGFHHRHLSPKPQLISWKHHQHINEAQNAWKHLKNQFYNDNVRFYGPTRPPLFDSTVTALSMDIVHKFEKLAFAGKK